MRKNLNVKSRILIALLSVTFLTAVTMGLVATFLGISTLKDEDFRKLTVVRELKGWQIENYFRSVRDGIRVFANSHDVASVMRVLMESANGESPAHVSPRDSSILKNVAESYGLGNLILVDAGNGRILYETNPDIQAGKDIAGDDPSGSLLVQAYNMARYASDGNYFFQTDFGALASSVDSVSAFVSAPVFIDGKKAGVLVFRLDIGQVNRVLIDGKSWEEMGLGKTGEAYLVGSDFLMRNESRFLLEDSSVLNARLRSAGFEPSAMDSIFPVDSMIRFNKVGADERAIVQKGITGKGIMDDYRGVKVLATYQPLNIPGLNWMIFSKMDWSEALMPIRVLFRKFAIYMVLLILLVVIVSVALSRDFSRPVEALARANEQLKIQSAAMMSAANGIIITDTRGIVQWVNPAFTHLTGYEFGEIVGNNLKLLNSGEQDQDFFRNLWSRILSGEVWHDEIVNRRKDGTLYTEEMTITPVRDHQGKISQFVAIKDDITERKRLEHIIRDANERMENELNVARDIQMSMLPVRFPAFPDRDDIDVHARLIPAREVGGDFYDYYFIDEENICFVVGDVSGKGVPASLFMAVTKALIKAASSQRKSAAGILSLVNNEISRDNENNMFITVFLAILNTTTGYLVYTNAGHNPPWILRGDGRPPEKMAARHGTVIGAFEGSVYTETVVRLERGDSVVLYTDGVTESQDIHKKLYSEARLLDCLSGMELRKPEEITSQVLEDVGRFSHGAEQADDITILVVSYTETDRDKPVDILDFELSNQLQNINQLIEKFEGFAGKHQVPVETIQRINVVFDELLTNTISYAYPGGGNHLIDVSARIYDDKLLVTILDDGIPFNPFDRPDPDTTLSLEERGIGGLGVHLVKLLVDEYDYEYKPQIGKNITTFKKNLK
jgi:sigma-B regulation protein RsbU (phosphoserine phosphatase)